MTLFDSNNNLTEWRIVDDVVMGGRSSGNFKINEAKHVAFFGKVSLENNGGFSMIQNTFDSKNISDFNSFCIKLKGDGKTYQFRVKTNASDQHSFTYTFKTSGDWQTINIPFSQLEPKFRGKKLNIPNYSGQQIDMIGFLIGNKKAEEFILEIECVRVFE